MAEVPVNHLSTRTVLTNFLLVGIGILLGSAGMWLVGPKSGRGDKVMVSEEKVWVMKARQDCKRFAQIVPLAHAFESVRIRKSDAPPDFVPVEDKARIAYWWLMRGPRAGETLTYDEVRKVMGEPFTGNPFAEIGKEGTNLHVLVDLYPSGTLVDVVWKGAEQEETVVLRSVPVALVSADGSGRPYASLELDQIRQMKVIWDFRDRLPMNSPFVLRPAGVNP